jgi:hypothetical protein
MLVLLGLALISVGVALVVLLTGIFGELLVIAGLALVAYKLFRVADSETVEMDRQAEIDARADELRSQHQKQV